MPAKSGQRAAPEEFLKQIRFSPRLKVNSRATRDYLPEPRPDRARRPIAVEGPAECLREGEQNEEDFGCR
jgi:hypothetical protein